MTWIGGAAAAACAFLLLKRTRRAVRTAWLIFSVVALIMMSACAISPKPLTAGGSAEPFPTDRPAETPVSVAAPAPTETEEPVEPEIPSRTEWLISFAGDCTIGTLHEWQGKEQPYNMLYLMGENYSYPFSRVSSYFLADDLTLVNCEGTFTDATTPKIKPYRFRSSPDHAQVFTEGGIDGVSLSNNHTVDYLEQGATDTRKTLDEHDILWTDSTTPLITTLEDGPKIGVISFCTVEIDLCVGDLDKYMERMEPVYQECVSQGCDIVIAFLHWGWENQYIPTAWQVEFGHRLADLGCDIVVGCHAHVLQTSETYNGVPIYYGMGNFCFGGCTDAQDKDSVIIQQRILRNEDGSYSVGVANIIPCRYSSSSRTNDFCPTPYEPGTEDFDRVLEKLKIEP